MKKPIKIVAGGLVVAGLGSLLFITPPQSTVGPSSVEFGYVTNCFVDRKYYFTVDGKECKGYCMLATSELDPYKQYLILARYGDEWKEIDRIKNTTALIYNVPMLWEPPYIDEFKIVEVE